jgi:general secretion pathway protein N
MAVQIRIDDSTIRIPANWLSALGAPWNTVAPKGLLSFKTQGLILTSALWGNLDQRMSGGAELTLENLSSQLSTLEPLGTYKIRIFNRAELRSPSATATNGMSGVAFGGASGGVFGSNNTNQAIALGVKLETIEGRLELSGDGLWSNNHFTFNGTAKAQTGFEAALANLLAVLGPRTDNMATLRIG